MQHSSGTWEARTRAVKTKGRQHGVHGGNEVAVFLSTFTNKIDRKGRVSVPAPFRTAIERIGPPKVFVLRSFKYPCLEGWSEERVTQIVNAIDQYPVFSEEAEIYNDLLAELRELSIDGDGRILVPEEFRDHAGLGETATFAGLGKSFQIWEPEAHAGRREASRAKIRDGGLSLPLGPSGNGGGSSGGGGQT